MRRRIFFVLFFLVCTLAPATAQRLQPPPPALYEVAIRYQIDAKRNERVTQYYDLLRDLKQAGFVRDPEADIPDNEPENPRADRLQGVIAPDRVPLLLKQRHVRTVLLKPNEAKLPGDEERVRVHLDLPAGLAPERQRVLYEQARTVLAALGFQEGAGYDQRQSSRLVGSIPVKQLNALLGDLRRQPPAWKLLSRTLLTDLRGAPGGQQALEDVIQGWYADKEGRKLVLETLTRWLQTPSGHKVQDAHPEEIIGDLKSPLLREALLLDLLRSPDAESTLTLLLAKVFADAAAPELVDRMLRRIEVQAASGLPVLFRGGSTLRVIEVFPNLPLPAPRPLMQPLAPELEKLTPDLRELVGDEAQALNPIRLELLFALTPDPGTVRQLANGQPVSVEGQLGPLVTVTTTLATAKVLALRDDLAAVRLPRRAQSLPLVPQAARKPIPLEETGAARLHALGQRGKGSVVAILDPDFRGWETQWQEKKLPKLTRLLDLTRERQPRFNADPVVGDPLQLGTGTRYALTIAEVAPDAELFLVRVDAAAPYMIQNVARAINGEGYHSLSLEERLRQLSQERSELDQRKAALLVERREAYRNFDEEGEAAKRREDYRQKQSQYDRDETDYNGRVTLYFQLEREFNELKRVRVAVSSLVWNEGHAVDGSGPLSRYFDDRPFKAALWFQAGGDSRGQCWTGLFRDETGEGVLSFAGKETPLPKGLWSHEYNFVKWQPANGPETLDVPENVKLRFTVQWREAHDPLYLQVGDDRYRAPLAKLRLLFVQQLDPTGQQQPSDDLQVLAESVGLPQRLLAFPNAATYEQTLEVRIAKPGRYAIRIEGTLPDTIAPTGAAVLPSARKFGELRPRLFVQTLDGPGRASWQTYWTEAGTIGMPAEAHQVIAVGALDRQRQRQPYCSRGPAQGMELLVKPDVLAYDDLDGVVFGSGQATAFAGGLAALTLNGNAPLKNWVKELGMQPGAPLRVPQTWPR